MRRLSRLALLACAGLVLAYMPSVNATDVTAAPVTATKSVGRWQDASPEDYRKHLQALTTITAACATGRDVKTCDPRLVGLDDRVPLGAGGQKRLVRYGWLRVLFSRAEESDEARQAPKETREESVSEEKGRPAPRTTTELLQDAQVRLAFDLREADNAADIAPDHSQERTTLQQVLTGKEFRNLKKPDARDSFLERLNRWLNHLFEGVDKLRTRSVWVGRALIWGFLLTVGVGLTWALMQLERRWRIRLIPESHGPAPDAASARDWQLWMADARAAAAQHLWREAIHFLYWASISRLESKRLWPADRARTPREYLALLAHDDSRLETLASLTQMFERTWYGGRRAGESDYLRAESLAGNLIGRGRGSGNQGRPELVSESEA